jgi:hypothetical protein
MKYDFEPLLQDTFDYTYPLYYGIFLEESYSIGHKMYMDGIDFSFDDWQDYEHSKLEPLFETDYNLLAESQKYFFGCSFDVYNKTYLDRLTTFLFDFPDANEVDFCDYELKKDIYYISSEFLTEKIKFSIKKRNEFLNDKKIQLTSLSHQIETEQTKMINSLNWQGTNLEFAELVKALFEANKLNPELKQTEIFKRLKQFFNIDEFNENDKLKDIRKRTNTTTPLINILETSLNNWITKKD